MKQQKPQRSERHKELIQYWVKVQAIYNDYHDNFGYTKLVPFYKANEMLYGKFNQVGNDVVKQKTLKYDYKKV